MSSDRTLEKTSLVRSCMMSKCASRGTFSRSQKPTRPSARVRPDCPMRLSARGSWLSCRLSNAQWPGSESPFCALSVTVDLDDGGINHGVFHVRFIRQCIEYALENIGFSPVSEPLEGRAQIAEPFRQIPPWAACPRNPQHRLYKQPIVPAATLRVGPLAQAKRFYLRPLGVRQHNAIHPERESHPPCLVNPHRS